MKFTHPDSTEQAMSHTKPWKRASYWLLFLGPFFFISYGFANWLASQQTLVAHIVFDWEQSIPFVPWTIIPYWSIDILYAISLFICTSKQELDSHGKRLLTAQVIAVICFLLFPLAYSFPRPEISGFMDEFFIRELFLVLSSFDQPFNQAPSLHIALLVILWVLYPRHLPRLMIWPFHILCLLIGVSVLTTYQHHFIDVPTGALLGWFSIWLWPEDSRSMLSITMLNSRFKNSQPDTLKRSKYIASYYLIAALLFTTLAFTINGWALWLLWPAISLLLVAAFYAFIGHGGFQKNSDGKISLASKWLLFPYLVGAKINSRLWTRKNTSADHISEGVWLGRFPSRTDIKNNQYHAVIDLTAELIVPFMAAKNSTKWFTLANLDLVTPSAKNLLQAAELIEHLKDDKPILVACALGYSRSTMAVIAWLLVSHRAENVDKAIEMVNRKHSAIIVKNSDRKVLAELIV